MKNYSYFLFSLSAMALNVSSANAAAWDMANDPRGFNVDWHQATYKNDLTLLPLEGGVPLEQTPWGDSYWPKNRGAFTYRWKEFQDSGRAQQLTMNDRQNLFFNYTAPTREELVRMNRAELERLSPFEKYSIVIGDFNYNLVEEYRAKNSAGDSYWEGYCHAWASASSHYAEPLPVEVPVTVNGRSIVIPFGSGDVKALLTANYADLGWSKWGGRLSRLKGGEKAELRYVGNLCKLTFIYPTTKMLNGVEVFADYADTEGKLDTELEDMVRKYQSDVLRLLGNKDPKTLTLQEQNRLRDARNSKLPAQARKFANDPACSDTNAGAFHIVMANELGLKHRGFLMDKTRDNEIWNQPVYKFETRITGYEPPAGNYASGTVRMANVETKLYYADDTDYGHTFWNPSLAGLFGLREYFTAFLDEYARYQNMLIREGDLDAPEEYPEHVLAHADYRYKLELDRNDKILGGQWITFDRPDDLYLMKKVGFVGDFKDLGKVYRPIHQ